MGSQRPHPPLSPPEERYSLPHCSSSARSKSTMTLPKILSDAQLLVAVLACQKLQQMQNTVEPPMAADLGLLSRLVAADAHSKKRRSSVESMTQQSPLPNAIRGAAPYADENEEVFVNVVDDAVDGADADVGANAGANASAVARHDHSDLHVGSDLHHSRLEDAANDSILYAESQQPRVPPAKKLRRSRTKEMQPAAESQPSTESALECDSCGKKYKSPNCLAKHRWEHTESWKLSSTLNLTKHHQVQILEAASVLVEMRRTRRFEQA
ncbi:uncharacterized protein BJ171DRAFT_517977 [Polychytrium aggregatum]|uniref:uncharacterized protein n=1 Tax=Polychytrium aggregatum TaxID=110093 RepID=UPI0022FF3951|nr:uncharacterized protein BJ171DRAFT_517977 [Polychytrium aggregatum]KAI9199576.1 hypothetical protein BJ171DRAFT_517977 [Polychytrium aggregatum]